MNSGYIKNKHNPKVTLAVMAFKRPEMIIDIIKSYSLQTELNKELLIIDDCIEDTTVKKIVSKYKKNISGIRFIKNEKNLGYCKNYLKMLNEARGEYIVILGDDDILIKNNALQKYVEIFEKHNNVSYVYSNIIQFNENYEMDLAFQTFKVDTLFEDIDSAIKNIWLKSCYIPGMAFRNNINFNLIYPKDYMLFPQVELVGKLLGSKKSFGIADFLIGGRAHSGQLGFAALKGKNIKKTEKPSVVEMQIITERVNSYFENDLKINYKISKKIANDFFKHAHATILPNEKLNVGNRQVLVTFWQGFKNNHLLIFDLRFMSYVLASLILPKRILYLVKEKRKDNITKKSFSAEIEVFNKFMRLIDR
jgi:glycosyltransferase involved in cell wall biosynthesis